MGKGEIRAVITIDASQFTGELNKITQQVQQLGSKGTQSTKGLGSAFQNMGKKIESAGVMAVAAGATIQSIFKPVAGILTNSVKASIDFESALTGVSKTTGYTGKALDEVGDAILNMSKRMPQSAEAIAGVMEIAAQLGVRGKDNLLKFTETAIRMGDATNLSAETASTEMARFLNITGSGVGTVDKLGSTIVALGNNTATTEAEIMSMGMRIAAAGRQVGLTDADIMGFSASLSSLGIKAEMGGSAFSKLMVNMEVACQQGGDSLNNFAKVAGVSADEFKNKFQKDAKGAIIDFLKGLNDIEKNGGSVINTLDEMGIGEVRLRDTILRAAAGVDQMTDNLDIANQAYEENTALVNESNNRYKTFASRLEMLKNKFKAVGVTIGKAMMPYMEKLLDIGNKIADWISGLNPKFLGFIGVIGLVGLGIGKLISVIGMLGISITGLKAVWGILTTVMGVVKSAFVAVGSAIAGLSAPVLAIIGVIAALVAGFVAAWKYCDGFADGVKQAFGGIGKILGSFGKLLKGDFVGAWNQAKEGATQAMEGIKNATKALWEGIKSLTSKAWEATKQFVKELPQRMSEAKEVMLAKLDEWKTAVYNKFIEIWGKAKESFDKFKAELPQKLAEAKQVMLNKLSEWKSAIYNKFMEVWDYAKQSFERFKEELPQKVEAAKLAVMNKLEEWKTSIPQKITELTQQMVEKINTWKDELPSKMDAVKTNMVSKIQAWGDSLPAKVDEVKIKMIQKLSTWAEELPQKIEEVMQGLIDAITGKKEDTANSMGEVMTGASDKVAESAPSFMGAMWECLQAIVKAIWEARVEILNAFAEVLWELIKLVFTDLIPALCSALWEAMKQAGQAILNAAPSVGAAMVQVWEACKKVTKEKWEEIKSAIKEKLNNIKSDISSKWDSIKSAVSSKIESIKSDVSSKWESIKSAVSNKLESIKSDVSSKWSSIKSAISNKMNEIKSGVSSGWDSIKSSISSKASGIMSAMKRPFEEAWNFIKGIPSKISSAFSNMKISIPKPKLPHINVGSKSFLDGLVTVPTFSISWYAKGGFFDGASMIGVGEAGKEAVLPLENKRNMKPYAKAVASLMDDMSGVSDGSTNVTIQMNGVTIREEADIKKLSEQLARLIDREKRRKGRDK